MNNSILVSRNPDTEGFLVNGHSYNILVTFSEYMDGAEMVPVSGETGDNYAIHKSTLASSLTIENYASDAMRTLEITGHDTAGNPLLKIAPDRKEINTAEITRNAAGEMQGEGGADTFHALRIEAGPPVIGYQDRNGIISQSCTGTCGTQAEPVNIALNTLKFSYSDIGSGIKEIVIRRADNALEQQMLYQNRVYVQDISLSLADGVYVQEVRDNTDKLTTMWFRVDPLSPRVEITGINAGFSGFSIYGVALDTGSGMDFLRFNGNGKNDTLPLNAGDVSALNFNFSGGIDTESYYAVTAQDRALNTSPQILAQFVTRPYALAGSLSVIGQQITGISARGAPCSITVTGAKNDFLVPINFTEPVADRITASLTEYSADYLPLQITPGYLDGNVTVSVSPQDACVVELAGRSLLPLAVGPQAAVNRNDMTPERADVVFNYGWLEATFRNLVPVAGATPKLRIENVPAPEPPAGRVVYPPELKTGWDIKYEGVTYDGVDVKICGLPIGLDPEDVVKFGVLHYHDSGAPVNITSENTPGCVTGTSRTTSIFTAVAEMSVFDKTGPVVMLNSRMRFDEDGALYLGAAAPVVLDAVDVSSHNYVLAGVASTYYLLDAEPTPGCLATAYSPAAARGTCANPLYGGAFGLGEGLHSLYYQSVDKIGNLGSAGAAQLRVDGTAPAAALKMNGAEIPAGATVYASITDIFTLSAFDPDSSGVASGLATTYFLVDISTEECAYAEGIGGINGMGSCENHFYSGPFSLPEGEHVIHYFGEDKVGNLAEAKKVAVSVGQADAPPVSSATLSGVMGRNGWHTSAVGVSFSAVDESTGVAGTYYSLDGAPFAPVPPPGATQPPAGWAYGERLRITERGGSALSAYQTLLALDTAELVAAGKLRPDCADLRFYSEGAALSHWLEGGCGSAQTRVWLKVPELPAGGSVDVSMAYGNPSAASVSNGPAVFDFYDDFNDNSIDTLRWRTVPGDCPMLERNGRLEFAACSTGSTLNKPWMVPLRSMPIKYVMETDVYGMNYGGDNAQAQIIALRWDGNFIGPNNPANGYILATFTGGSPMGAAMLVELAAEYGARTVLTVNDVFQPAQWQKLAIADDALGLDLYVDGAKIARYATENRWGDLWALSGRDYPSPSSVYYDNFRLRKYAAAEGVSCLSGAGLRKMCGKPV